MNSLEKILDRIEKSFFLYKKGFINLSLPYLIYNVVLIVILPYLLIITLFPLFTTFFSWFFNWFDLTNLLIIIFPLLFAIFFYILFFITIFLMTIKTISFYYENKQNDKHNSLKEELTYARKNIWSIMKTYWYIFEYVALIPSIIFIVWWLIFNINFFVLNEPILSTIGATLMIGWWILFIIFALYRWIKSSFALYSAIDNNDYTKDNFKYAISITKNNWLRILWNSIVIWFIVWLLSGVIVNMINFLIPSGYNIWFIENLSSWNFSVLGSFNYFLLSLFDALINSVWAVFMAIFMYILYKDIQSEKQNVDHYTKENNQNINNEL